MGFVLVCDQSRKQRFKRTLTPCKSPLSALAESLKNSRVVRSVPHHSAVSCFKGTAQENRKTGDSCVWLGLQ